MWLQQEGQGQQEMDSVPGKVGADLSRLVVLKLESVSESRVGLGRLLVTWAAPSVSDSVGLGGTQELSPLPSPWAILMLLGWGVYMETHRQGHLQWVLSGQH